MQISKVKVLEGNNQPKINLKDRRRDIICFVKIAEINFITTLNSV